MTFGEHTISLKPPFRRLSLREAAREAASRRLGIAVTESDLRSRESAASLAARLGIDVMPAHGAGKITASIFETLCEGDLVQPVFVYDFPTEVSPLSKQRKDDPDTVERFELVRRRIRNRQCLQRAQRSGRAAAALRAAASASARGGHEEAHAMDDDYIRALEYGLPPTAGEGIGIDRLVMVLTNSPSIRDVILFPLMRQRLG